MIAILTWLALAAILAFVALIVWNMIRDRTTATQTITGLSPAPDRNGDVLVAPGQILSGMVTITALRDIPSTP